MKARERLEAAFVELKWREYENDPEKFFTECVQVPAGEILGGTKGRTSFELFDYQRQALADFRENRYTVVLKARQLGLTTLAMAYAMWMLFFRPGSNIVLVSRSQTAADKALEIVDFMYSFLPEWVKERGPAIEGDAAKYHSYRFDDGMVSRITSYAATRTVAAGQTASLVLWDEAALAEYQEDALRTLLPTTDAGGSMIVFSTARGAYNAFARLYRDAERGDNEFKPVFFPWYYSRFMNPSGTPENINYTHYESKKRAMASEPWLFYAEYPADSEEAFRQSGRSRFPNLPSSEEFEEFPLRGDLRKGFDGEIEFFESPTGVFWAREEFLSSVPRGTKAVVAVDPSSGTGGDYTSMCGGWLDEDGVPQRVVFWHSNVVEPGQYAAQAALLGEYLSDGNGWPAIMVVEKQGGYGDTLIHLLREGRYKNLYVHRYTGHRKYRQENTYGFPMSASSRPLVIDVMGQWLDWENGKVMGGIDAMLRRELGAFVVKADGKVGADVGMNDDLVMSTAIWLYVASQNPARATEAPVDETVQQVYSVGNIWQEAEQIWRANDRSDREYARKMRRHLTWR